MSENNTPKDEDVQDEQLEAVSGGGSAMGKAMREAAKKIKNNM